MKPKLLEARLGGGRLLKRTSGVLIVVAFGAASLYGALSAFAAPPSKTAVDAENASYAQMMLDEGKKTFRYETFGSEAFWGDTLQLQKAIAGEKNGGVGAGVSPKTALSASRSTLPALIRCFNASAAPASTLRPTSPWMKPGPKVPKIFRNLLRGDCIQCAGRSQSSRRAWTTATGQQWTSRDGQAHWIEVARPVCRRRRRFAR